MKTLYQCSGVGKHPAVQISSFARRIQHNQTDQGYRCPEELELPGQPCRDPSRRLQLTGPQGAPVLIGVAQHCAINAVLRGRLVVP